MDSSPDIESLSDVELGERIRSIFDDYAFTLSSFCQRYKLHKGNFSKWMRGLKESPKSRNTVISFLKDPSSIPSLKVPKGSLPDILCVQGVIQKLYIVDGDQYNYNIKEKHGYLSTLKDGTHITTCYAATSRKHLTGFTTTDSLSFIPTRTNCREAADVTISMESMHLHLTLPPDIEFFIVTKDVFAIELTSRLRSYGRKASWIKEFPF